MENKTELRSLPINYNLAFGNVSNTKINVENIKVVDCKLLNTKCYQCTDFYKTISRILDEVS